MKSNIFIPKTIKVGYQNRNDTYTQKLAYVIYIDEKGKIRKEASWNSWRDKKIDPTDFPNEPTSGFVLNKKAGGYSTGWNHRQTYTRVYDSRGFEFEITVPNLLYILENTNSIKGKGLEGEFVYGWDGSDLLLLPTSSPDYIDITQYNDILHEKNYIKTKDLKLGATYKTKDNSEWIYMGRFDLHDTKSERVVDTAKSSGYYGTSYTYICHNVNKGKHHFFAQEATSYDGKKYLSLLKIKSLGEKFIGVVESDCVENYSDLFDRLEKTTVYSPYDKGKDEYINFSLEEFTEYIDSKKLDELYYNRNFNVMTDKYNSVEIRYDAESKEFYLQGEYDREKRGYVTNTIGNVEQLFNRYNPIYKNEYLENGKLYRRLT